MALAPRGRHVQIGLMLGADAAPAVPVGRIIARELHLIGSHGMGAAAYPELLAQVASGALQPERLIGDSIALSELPAAIGDMDRFATRPGVTIIEKFSA